MSAGSILDFYDDPSGFILRQKVASVDQLPDYIREADFRSPEKLASLHDDAFALIMVDGGKKMRKYACTDKGNTALSVIYFLENQHKLTKEAQQVAANNLVDACVGFGLEVPTLLKIAAGPKTKKADLTGTEVMPLQASEPTNDHAAYTEDGVAPISSVRKTAAASPETRRYVDVTGRQVMRKVASIQHQRYCLVKEGTGHFPLDSYGDVVEANRWFEENRTSLSPADRREYCTKLASRADELGIRVTDNIRKYAGAGYADRDDVMAAVATRMQYWSEGEPERTLLQGLMGKYASVAPDVFCEALSSFDRVTGLDLLWDDGIPDPVASTYGFEKKAEWTWAQGSDLLKEDQLKQGVLDSGKIHQIKARFGGDVAKGLVENPVQVFDSLPLDSKRIISRIVLDTQ